MATRYEYEDGEDFSGSGYGKSKFTAATKGTTLADLGTYGLISSKYGPLQTFDAPLSNKGNATSQMSGTNNTFAVGPQTSVRLVNNATGEVVFEGVGYEAGQKARDLAQELSDTGGNKANWDIQAAAPGMSGYASVAHEKANKSPVGTIMDIGLPILANALLPGSGFLGQALGKVGATMAASALGSAASGTLQGKSLGDIAKSAGLSAATAGLMQGTPIGKFVNKTVGNIPIVGDLSKELSKAVGSIPSLGEITGAVSGAGTGALSNAAANALADEIIVTALPQLASSAAGSALSSSLANSIANKYPTYTPPAAQSPLMQQTPPETSGLDTLSDLTVTGTRLPNVSSFAVTPAVQSLLEQYAVKPAEQPVEQQTTEQQPEQTTEQPAAQDEIVVTAQEQLPPVNPFAVNTGVQNLIDQYAGNAAEQTTEQPEQKADEADTAKDEIIVTAQDQLPIVNPFAVNTATQNLIDGYAAPPSMEPVDETVQQEDQTKDGDEIIVTAQDQLPPVNPFAVDLSTQNLIDNYAVKDPAKTTEDTTEDTAKDEIIVTGDKPLVDLSGLPSLVTDLAATTGPKLGDKVVEPKSTTDKITDYMKALALGIGLVGNIGGGGKGGSGSAGTYNPGRAALDPIFSAKLPTPGTAGAFTVGGLGGTAGGADPLAARPTADWYRYGMGPAMDVPAGTDMSKATSPYAGYGPGTLGEETFKQVTGMSHGGPMGYSRGSTRESFAVQGPGTGRSDDIPAVLSDGEYVIDAETVALLGDGSSRAGAKKLDDLRIKVRKHKGKNLAQGKFSVNARNPEAYMLGGRI